jgi:hypothetical protein
MGLSGPTLLPPPCPPPPSPSPCPPSLSSLCLLLMSRDGSFSYFSLKMAANSYILTETKFQIFFRKSQMRKFFGKFRYRKSANYLGGASPQIANPQICLDEPAKLKSLNCHSCGRLANLSPKICGFAICGTYLRIAHLCKILT